MLVEAKPSWSALMIKTDQLLMTGCDRLPGSLCSLCVSCEDNSRTMFPGPKALQFQSQMRTVSSRQKILLVFETATSQRTLRLLISTCALSQYS